MRLRQRDKRPVVFKKRVPVKEPDGTTYEDWGEPVTVYGNIQPAGGRVMAEMYGERAAYMLTMFMEGRPAITESAGAWVDVPDTAPKPDYRVIAIRPWGAHTVVDLEKVR